MARNFWHLPTCPPGGQCVIEIGVDTDDWLSALRFCPFHAAMNAGGTAFQDIGDRVKTSMRRLSTARYAIRLELALENSAIPFTVDASGNFTLHTGETGQTRTRLRNAVTTAIADLPAPAGVSTITVN